MDNREILARLNRMVEETRAEIARERLAVRLMPLVPLVIAVPYLAMYYEFQPFLALLRLLSALRTFVCGS